PEDQEPVETFPAHAAYSALRAGIRVRRLDRRSDDLDAFAGEDRVEGMAELPVAIMDQEAVAAGWSRRDPSQVARLLHHPRRIRMTGTGDVLDSARPDRDEEL